MTELKDIPFGAAFSTYLSWTVLFLVGHIRDFLAGLFWGGSHSVAQMGTRPGYAPLRQDYEDFYTRRAYYRVVECFSRPVDGPPDRVINVELRHQTGMANPVPTGKQRPCINLGSYNYLGFANQDAFCTPRCLDSVESMGPSACAARENGGTSPIVAELEGTVAAFVGKPDALVFGMGYITNSAVIPALVGAGDLIISDTLNHNSIVTGARGSGARVRVFKHNDAGHLERVLREAISHGQPRTRRPWHKILIVVEGIYSMEGEMCCLPAIVEVKKRYGAYLYLDEAHSIGALGATGRGVCEQLGVATADIDIMMGTFTKSFGSCGGYIASSADVIAHLKATSPAWHLAAGMSALAAQQVLSAFKLLLGEDGSTRGAQKIAQLKANSNYFRWHLMNMGFHVLGDWDSPIMPIMLYLPGALRDFSQLCLQHHVAVVVVGFPATSLLTARARICISAAHCRGDLEYCLDVFARVGVATGTLYRKSLASALPNVCDVVKASGEYVDLHSKIV